MKVTISKKQLLAFRRQCRQAWPKETLAVLWGVRTPDGVTVTDIKHIPHTASHSQVDVEQAQITKSKVAALRAGVEFLGSIHSHCNSKHVDTCSHPSDCDVESALDDGEILMGIVYVWLEGRRSEVSWYQPKPKPEIQYEP